MIPAPAFRPVCSVHVCLRLVAFASDIFVVMAVRGGVSAGVLAHVIGY